MIGNRGYELPLDEKTARYICVRECNEKWCFFRELAGKDINLRKKVESLPRYNLDKNHCAIRDFVLEKASDPGETYSRRNVIQGYFISILKYKRGIKTWTEGSMVWVDEGYSDVFRELWDMRRDFEDLDRFYSEIESRAEDKVAARDPLLGVVG